MDRLGADGGLRAREEKKEGIEIAREGREEGGEDEINGSESFRRINLDQCSAVQGEEEEEKKGGVPNVSWRRQACGRGRRGSKNREYQVGLMIKLMLGWKITRSVYSPVFIAERFVKRMKSLAIPPGS